LEDDTVQTLTTFSTLFALSFLAFLIFFQVIHKSRRRQNIETQKEQNNCASCTCQGNLQKAPAAGPTAVKN